MSNAAARNLHPRPVARACLQALLVLLAAARAEAWEKPLHMPHIPHMPHTPLEIDLEAACPGTRWIGLLPSAPRPEEGEYRGEGCPYSRYAEKELHCPDGWAGLFPGSPSPELRRYCLLDCTAAREHLETYGKSLPPRVQRLCRRDLRRAFRVVEDDLDVRYRLPGPKHGYEELDALHRDCRVVGPAAGSSFSRVQPVLEERFLREAGAPEDLRGARRSNHRVRLVVVDSAGDTFPLGRHPSRGPEDHPCRSQGSAETELECSYHGFILAVSARELLCRDDSPNASSCLAEVTARRALRRTWESFPPGEPRERDLGEQDPAGEHLGGLYGYRSDLATAIQREVAAWSAEDGPPRLILNLSLGWEHLYGVGADEVRSAIEDAVCRGALVLAAAGNRIAGPTDLERPLLPAAWEAEPAPTPDECQARHGVEPPAGSASYRPLVFAVGGVERRGRPLANARPSSTPRLVAFGDHASVPLPQAPPEAAAPLTLTGTSVSTLVVSAAAARLWNENPRLDAFGLMERLHEESAEGRVQQGIDFCLEPWPNCHPHQAAREVEVDRGARRPEPEPWPPEFDSSVPYQQVEPGEPWKLRVLPGCKPQILAYVDEPEPGAVLCPQRGPFLDVAAQPWLGPTPGANHNPNCTYSKSSPGKLLLEFTGTYRLQGSPVELSNLTLIAGARAYRLTNETIRLGDRTDHVRIFVPDPDFADDLRPMYLAATIDGKYAIITPILVAAD